MNSPRINPELTKGSAVTVVLTLLGRRDMYGYELAKSIERESRGAFAFKEGTLYPILHQLEKDDAIESRWEESEDGRKRKVYRITRHGRKLLLQKTQEWLDFRSALEKLLSGAES